jgi:hypothetical protein
LEDPKQLIVTLLSGNIAVYDDDDQAVTVSVSAAWPNADTTFPYVSVGPEIGTRDEPSCLGADKFKSEGTYQVDIWVKEPSAGNYSTDRMLFRIRQEIKRLVKAAMFDPDATIKYVYPSFWHETFEQDLMANRLTGHITVYYYESRLVEIMKVADSLSVSETITKI